MSILKKQGKMDKQLNRETAHLLIGIYSKFKPRQKKYAYKNVNKKYSSENL